MSFFNIRSRNKYKSGAMGIIGGSAGPTSIFIAENNRNKIEEHEKFLAYAAEQIAPCKRAFKQVEEYLIEKYHATQHIISPNELTTLKVNVILNYFGDVLDKPEPLGDNPTEEEIIEYFKKDTSVLQAKEYPAEKLGLEFKAYKLPDIKSEIKHKKHFGIINSSYFEGDVIIGMETRSEYLCVFNGGDGITGDLLLYQGVSEKDIKEKTPRFIAYAYALRDMEKL